MPPTRRWAFFILISVFVILTFHQIRRTDHPIPIPVSNNKPAPNTPESKFRWIDRPVHYPLKSLISLPIGQPKDLPKVQHTFGAASQNSKNEERRQEVKDAFVRCWESYRKHAWLHDELAPISGRSRDIFGGWAATLVDALDTLWIMNLKKEFEEAVAATAHIDFTRSSQDMINVFETTIRYLGGFLSAYDLSGDKRLLDKAMDVGEMLLVPFDTPNRLPITRWYWQTAATGSKQVAPEWMLVSELGSLSLEFTRLSQLTGDHRWYDAIQRITELLAEQQETTSLPGMWPIVVNPRDRDMTTGMTYTLGGMSDSLYEYFPKEYALLGGLEPVYQKMYELSIPVAIEHLFFRPMTPTNEDILISGDIHKNKTFVSYDYRGQHLGCFAGGMLGLGGRLFQNEEHIRIGRKLTDGCVWAYKATDRGVMPEIAHFAPCESKISCTWDKAFWGELVVNASGRFGQDYTGDEIASAGKIPHGYTAMDDKRYILRPEAIESVFIMYRITGDTKYQEDAWEMFKAIQKISKTEYGNAAVVDITSIQDNGLPVREDRMESFWLAETLKYFYLIFSEPDLISLDEYVLNTEAHPFKRPR